MRALISGFVLFLATACFAQNAEPTEPELSQQPAIQAHLKMTTGQIANVKKEWDLFLDKSAKIAPEIANGEDITKAYRKALRKEEMGHWVRLYALLEPAQQIRLKQIFLQKTGFNCLRYEPIQKDLSLTPEQLKKIVVLEEQQYLRSVDYYREAFQNYGSPDKEEALQFETENRKKAAKELGTVLTEEQQTKLKQLQGEPFKG